MKEDKEACGTVLHICLKIVKALAMFTAPYLPFSSDQVWKIFDSKKSIHDCSWDDAFEDLKVGTTLEKPKPLFKKLLLEEFMPKEDIFSKLDLRVAKILAVKDHPNADSLYMMHIDLGKMGKRVIVAGVKKDYTIDEMKNRNIVVVTNLKPANLRGITSNGMLLAATDDTGVVSLLNPGDANPGSEVIVEGIQKSPEKVLEFEDFKKIKMEIDENQNAIYNGKKLKSEKGYVVSDKNIKKGSSIS